MRHFLQGLVGAAIILMALPTIAQDELPIELMLMVDTSTSMGHSMTAQGRGPLRHCVEDYRSRRRDFRGGEEEIVTWLPNDPEYVADWSRLQSIKQVLAGRPVRNVDLTLDDKNKTACFASRMPLDPDVARSVYADLVGLGPGVSDEADIFGNGGLKISAIEGRETTRRLGRGGGDRYVDQCPLGEVLIGISGQNRTGDADIGRVRGICGRVSFDGQEVHTIQASQLPFRGVGVGGAVFASQCPDGQVLAGVGGQFSAYLDRITLHCAPILLAGERLAFGVPEALPPVGGNGPDDEEDDPDAPRIVVEEAPILCRGGKLTSGFFVNTSGELPDDGVVHAVGLQCATQRIEFNVGIGADTKYVREMLSHCYDFNAARPAECQPLRILIDETPADRFHSDGLIHQYSKSVKFGLMTTDDIPGDEFDFPAHRRGGSSFGSDHTDDALDAGIFAANALLANRLNGNNAAPRQPNLGVRGPAAGKPGDLVSGHMGLIEDGRRSAFRPIGEDPNQVERHNDYIMQSIRGLSPFGFSPLSAMLYDLHYYYRTQDPSAGARDIPDRYGLIPDLKFGCRRHVAVLLTDGSQSNFYASRDCLKGWGPCPLHAGYPYLRMAQYVDRLERSVPSFGFHIILLNGTDEAAAELSAAVGNREGAFAHVRTHQELRAALDDIIKRHVVKSGSKTRPLIVSPDDGDEVDDKVRQYRVSAYTDRINNTPYGRVLGEALGCRGGQFNDPQGRLQFIRDENVKVHESLARQRNRTTVSSLESQEASFQVLGNGPRIFSDAGEFRAQPGMTERRFRTWTETPVGGGAVDPLSFVFKVVSGFFGPAAEPAGDGSCDPVCGPFPDKVRQLGEKADGDLISIPPPRLGLDSESYQRFRTENRTRPTLIGTGARDGAIHFFRLFDGYEVFSFVPHLAWKSMRLGVAQPGAATLQVDGPLMARDVAVCRSLGDGREGCPADAQTVEFRTLVVGGVGDSGANIFGVDITEAKALMDPDSQGQAIDADTFSSWDLITRGDGLGGGQ